MKKSILFIIVLLIIGCGHNKSDINSVKDENFSMDIDVYEESRRTGIEAYNEQRYEYALQCFMSVAKIAPHNNDLRTWIQKCQQKIIPENFVLIPSGVTDYMEYRVVGDHYIDEPYSVKLDSFYISKYELVQKEFENVMGKLDKDHYTWTIYIDGYTSNKRIVVEDGDSIPVNATYMELIEYCNKKSLLEGYDGFYSIDGNKVSVNNNGNGYRLLNLYEWLYAARECQKRNRYSYIGSNKVGEVAWFGGNSSYKPHKVGQKKPNSIGLYDMSGNVEELVQSDPKVKWRLVGGGEFSRWVNLSDEFVGQEKDSRFSTRIAFVPRNITNNNTNLHLRYGW